MGRPRGGSAWREPRRARGLAARSGGDGGQPRPARHVGPDGRLRDDEPQRRSGFMSLFHCGKPVVCKVHGFCVAGGTDMALCSDLLVIADDAKIGYPPARVWGSPTTALWAHRIGAQRAKRLLFTGDSLSGAEAVEWGLAIEAPPAERARRAHRGPASQRIARMPDQPADDDEAARQPDALRAGPARDARCSAPCSTASRGTPPRATPSSSAPPRHGFREAVRERDEPFGDARALDVQRLTLGASPRSFAARARRGLECALRADVAQLARASPCHGEGRGFESLHPLRSGRAMARAVTFCAGGCRPSVRARPRARGRQLCPSPALPSLSWIPGPSTASIASARFPRSVVSSEYPASSFPIVGSDPGGLWIPAIFASAARAVATPFCITEARALRRLALSPASSSAAARVWTALALP